MAAYVLQSGKFPGRAIEALMFEWNGFHHLERVLYNANKHSDSGSFAVRVRDLFQRAKAPRIVVQCQCGRTAKYIAAKIRVHGTAFFGYHCEQCKKDIYPDATAVLLSFDSVKHFDFATDKKLFLNEMRRACGLNGRVSAEEAHEVFYPPTPTPAPVQPAPRLVSSPIQPSHSQLPLF